MGWQHYRGKQATAHIGSSFLNSENEEGKVKLCFKMINWLSQLTSILFGKSSY